MSNYKQVREDLTFGQLLRYSDPKRVLRSNTVRMPPLDIEARKSNEAWYFNCKSFPSSTGKRHKGVIVFKKTADVDEDTPLEEVPIRADCTCPDFLYRYAFCLHQHNAADIGPQSINKCIDRPPRRSNPSMTPGGCKHILALRNFIYGQNAKFAPAGGDESTSERLDKLVKAANGRTINAPAARERERRMVTRNQLRRVGVNPDLPDPNLPPAAGEPEPAETPGNAEQGGEPPSRNNPTNPRNPRNSGNRSNESTSLRQYLRMLVEGAS